MRKAFVSGTDFQLLLVDVAETPEEIQTGLAGRTHLSDSEGMLFPVQDESFWMKGMLIPIDMIWLDSDGYVIELIMDASPCEPGKDCTWYLPNKRFSYVLEVAAGFVDRHNIHVGQRLYF